MNELAKENEKLMTVKEVAGAMGVSYDTVNNCVKRLFPEIVKNGLTTHLNEAQIACISKELKNNAKVTEQLTFEAGSKVKNTTTRLEVLLNYKSATEALVSMIEAEKNELKKQIESQKMILAEQKPKVEFYDDVTGSADTIDVGEAAKILNIKGIGRNNLFELLRQKNILRDNNQPYQKYVDAGYFRIIESRYVLPTGETKISLKTVVFQKGLDFIRKTVAEAV